MIRARLRHRRGDDRGASLIIALAFVTAIGLVVGSLLGYASANFTAAATVRARAQLTYDAEGALQAAINATRNSPYDNGTSETCLGSGSMSFPGPNGSTVTVDCTPGVGTGAAGSDVPINDHNKPPAALMTLGGNGAEPGLGVGSNNVLRIRGAASIRSTITSGGTACSQSPQPPTTNCSEVYNDHGQVHAGGACAGVTVYSIPAAACDIGSWDPDPSYAQPSSSGLDYQEVPTTCPAGPVLRFDPGYYDDGAALNQLFAACPTKTFWFTPGTYVFDFHNDGGDLWSGSSHVWKISSSQTRVVGGTPSGWNPAAPWWAFTQPSIPGSCVSPLSKLSSGTSGVKFVFGGDSQLQIGGAQVELCGSYASSSPPIAIYGAKSGADPAPVTATLVTDGTGSHVFGDVPFANPPYITDSESPIQAATATISDSFGPDTAGVTVQGFSPDTVIPAGSILTSAQLLVSHRDDNWTNADRLDSIDLRITPSRAGASSVTASAPTYRDRGSPDYHQDNVDLTADLQDEIHAHGFSGMSVRYEATVARNDTVTENLDTIQLVLTYRPPAVRAENGCVGTAPYVPNSANCALITTSGSPTRLYVQGTTYAPRAALDIQLTNVSGQVFRMGLVARSVRATITASSGFDGAVFEIPDNSNGSTPLDVYYTAYACPSGTTCSGTPPGGSGWLKLGVAEATFTDSGGVPVPGSRDVAVRSWQVFR